MTTPPLFWHSGGDVVSARGVIPLAAARAIALDLALAVETAHAWRRAAGWRNPDEADGLQGPAFVRHDQG